MKAYESSSDIESETTYNDTEIETIRGSLVNKTSEV